MKFQERLIYFLLSWKVLAVLDLCLLFAILWGVFRLKFGLITDLNVFDFQLMFESTIAVRMLFYALLGLYRLDLEDSFLDLIYRVFWGCVVISGIEYLILLSIRNYYLPHMGISRQVIVYCWLSWFIWGVGIRAIYRWGRLRVRREVNLVLLGSGTLTAEMIQEIGEFEKQGYQVQGFVGDKLSLPDPQLRLLGSLSDLPQVLKEETIHQVVILDNRLAQKKLPWLLEVCETHGATLKVLPNLYELLLGKIHITKASAIPLVDVMEISSTPLDRMLKRALDIFFALFALVAILWIWLLIWVLVKLDDQESEVFDRLTCVGKNGKEFYLKRFRTTASSGPSSVEPFKLTPIGFILRRLELDRIPQLFNVLKGEMSLVGPRPMTPEFFDTILQEEPLYRLCLRVKPGITGMAQIHGQSHYLHSKLRYDLSYIYNWTFLLDLKILFQTCPVFFTGQKIRD